ncbi:MAG TPA: NUDIX domain-containing protein [Candidatus Stackebrandtia faecavium]|nr:NUDIX domain-containing protein [Candidatus Stackebrandtia faecavium]
MGPEIIERNASRVLLQDSNGRLLLLRGCDPANPQEKFWFTVGGGVDDGEGSRQAACREVKEETGIVLPEDALTGPVHNGLDEFPFDGALIRQRNSYFIATVAQERPDIDTSGFEQIEQESVDRNRWWTREELAHTTETVYPNNLLEILDR